AALDHGIAVIRHPEEHAAIVVIEEIEIPERHHLACEMTMLQIMRGAEDDQISQDRLLLLPEILGVTPGEFDRQFGRWVALHRVKAAAAELIDADLCHVCD